MGTTTHSIDVKAPLRSVYDQWTQFEEFPRFMRDVVEVRQHGPDALSWKVLMGGKALHDRRNGNSACQSSYDW